METTPKERIAQAGGSDERDFRIIELGEELSELRLRTSVVRDESRAWEASSAEKEQEIAELTASLLEVAPMAYQRISSSDWNKVVVSIKPESPSLSLN